MVEVLNFGSKDKKQIKDLLKKFEEVKTGNEFEEFRAKINSSVVTLYHTGKITIQGNDSEKVKELIISSLNLSKELVLGFDETGRGEKTGPFVVSGILGETNSLRDVRDSKKTLNIKKGFNSVSKNSLALFSVSLNAEYIDSLRKKGHTMNSIEADFINSAISFFENKDKTKIVVDGGKINGVNEKAEFIPGADDLEPVVSAASIYSRHLRDESKDNKLRKTWNLKK